MAMIADRMDSQDCTIPTSIVAKHLKTQERDWAIPNNKNKPLQLLDLPLDVLQAIIREVTHTNDLTSLALTHSVLHALVIPYIYSRFDIVWPDASPTMENRVGVDALTYGLATLVMAQDVFGESTYRYENRHCNECGSPNFCQHRATPVRSRKTRRGNHFAQYTKKFSLGNGPEDWVKEYLITKEGGKMLGTLVALAVGRMRNLENFTWDMPTGVLRDVWLALASLDDREDGQPCRLERVWVRWHDNQDSLISPPFTGASPGALDLPHLISGAVGPSFQIPPYPRVEFPTFSVLPPLTSLSVLDIDEMSYVEEMSVLIERSLDRLKELRVSLARHAHLRQWARPREDRAVVPPHLAHLRENNMRRGGILGTLVHRFCPAFNDAISGSEEKAHEVEITHTESSISKSSNDVKSSEISHSTHVDDINQLGILLSSQHLNDESSSPTPGDRTQSHDAAHSKVHDRSLQPKPAKECDGSGEEDQSKLRLNVLELERVYLSIPVLSRAFDWSRLRTLTILSCREHENLWRAMRKKFAPVRSRSSSISKMSTSLILSQGRSSVSDDPPSIPASDYELRITRIHTDMVTTALLAFIKDTLAPDTLEHLFLQASPLHESSVTVDQIYKHAIRRHRASLRKLLIDSTLRSIDGTPEGGSSWQKWAFNRELITCITSSRMHLRELSMVIDYRAWHYFLQRLPNAPSLRSLHISNIAEQGNLRMDARETALQVLDIVALRPELELCYVGIHGKCFEILECSSNRKDVFMLHDPIDSVPPPPTDDDDVSDDHDDHGNDGNGNDSDGFSLNTDDDRDDDSEDEPEQGASKPALRLREILFYDDKISIFKARHGRL